MTLPLAVIPTYVTAGRDVEMLHNTLKSLRAKTPDDRLDILVVDDGSPDTTLKSAVANTAARFDAEVHLKVENTGFSRTVNVGLQRALDEGRDAILVNSDIEILSEGWLDHMEQQDAILVGEDKAGIVGGLLLYPNMLIQHGGIYFSLLTREFDHLWKHAPHNLPIARQPQSCPVTGALQFIRHEVLTTVGIYDERFRMGMEDVDYCIRTFLAGFDCVYQPKVRAYHYESAFRGRSSEKLDQWHKESFRRFMEKWHQQSFAGLVPFI